MSLTERLDWIETDHEFDVSDQNADSYFIDPVKDGDMINEYHFDTLPELKRLLSKRLAGSLSEKEFMMAARETFRNKPEYRAFIKDSLGREVVDFIYEM